MASDSVWKYRWFDTPNNQDGLKKAIAFGKIGFRYGFALGAIDALLMDKATYLQRAARLGGWVVPAVGMTTAFTITEQVSLKLFPKMDEKFAFMFGGWSAGGILGYAFKSSEMSFSAALILGGVGFVYQYMREGRMENVGKWREQFMFFPDKGEEHFLNYERRQASHWLTNTYDYRLLKQPKRGGEVEDMYG